MEAGGDDDGLPVIAPTGTADLTSIARPSSSNRPDDKTVETAFWPA